MAVAGGDDAALGEHVDDRGDEEPPVALLVVVVEQAVLAPCFLVLV